MEARPVGRCDENIFEDRQAAERARDLMRAGKAEPAALGRRQVGDVFALEADAPGGRAERAGKYGKERRLAGAVRSDDADRFVRPHREIDAVKDRERVETLDDPPGGEDLVRPRFDAGFAHSLSSIKY